MADLSVLIPARNEMFLARTIEDILKNMRGDTEIIAVMDGGWIDPPVPYHPRVTIIHHATPIGQRAATNEAARLSTAKFVMKCDAHCAFDEGFDVKLMADCEHNWLVVPRLYNLHVFDWRCNKCGWTNYQGPTPTKCPECDNTTDFERVILWQPRWNRRSDFMRFDTNLKFNYWGSYGSRPEAQGDIADTMSTLGACRFMHREYYWELGGCDESFGTWGQEGTEWACKVWLSGGRQVVNKKTWYSHMFRTQGGDFGFPYPLSGHQVDHARKRSRELFIENKWEKQVYPLSWLIDKFAPVPDWHDESGKEVLNKVNEAGRVFMASKSQVATKARFGIVYYTDNQLDPKIMQVCQDQLKNSVNGSPIVSVSLKPINFGDNIVLPLDRGYLTMFRQILAGLERLDCEYVFFAEHDLLYNPTHFQFVPTRSDTYYYNTNVWKVRLSDGHALHYDCKQTSGLCARRELLVQHYRQRVANTEAAWERYGGNTREFRNWIRRQGFEPGTHGRAEAVDRLGSETWQSEMSIIDIRHDGNLTPSRWSQDQFRDKRNCRNWIEADEVPGWGKIFIEGQCDGV